MKIKKLILVVGIALSLFGIGRFFAVAEETPQRVRIEKILGENIVEMIRAPDLVCKGEDKKALLTRKQIVDLQDLLLNDQSYEFHVKKKSLFLPEAHVKFHKGETLDLFVGYQSGQIKLVLADKVYMFDVDPITAKLQETLQ
jgi:hypothetical protein